MGRSALLVIAYLGCLKAGLAYLPLDKTLPFERLKLMVQLANCPMVLTASECPLSHVVQECIFLSPDCSIIRSTPIIPLPTVGGQRLSNVMFTSGSTGVPKGVMLEHKGMVNLCAPETMNWNGDLRSGLTAGIAFDISGHQIFASLLTGSELHILPDSDVFDANAYQQFLIQSGVQRVSMTPSILATLLEVGSEWLQQTSLKNLTVGGEALQPSKICECRRHLPNLEIFAGYGPTEATVWGTYLNIPAMYDEQSLSRIPIGRAVLNTSAHVVDLSLYPVPPGVLGEIVLSGVQLARGYLAQPELTAQRFVKLPEGHPIGERLYRTGDLGYWTHDGLIQFVGRNDNQFKLRGQRIEAEEVEAVLNQHSAVKASTVVVVSAKARSMLVAYVQLHSNISSDEVAATLDMVRLEASKKLPHFLVPVRIIRIQDFPLSNTGKLDRKLLATSDYMLTQTSAVGITPPKTDTEKMIQEIFSQVLDMHVDAISVTETLFHLGGDSLLATRMLHRIRQKLNVTLPIMAIFDNPTISGIATLVDSEKSTASLNARIPRLADERTIVPASDAQKRLWVEEQMNPGLARYNAGFQCKVLGPLDIETLQQAFSHLVNRHEALRTTYQMREAVLMQNVMVDVIVITRVVSAYGNNREGATLQILANEHRKQFDLEMEIPIRCCIIRTDDPDVNYISVVIHHIATDGWSATIIRQELAMLYNSLCHRSRPQLQHLPIRYRDYSAWQANRLTDLRSPQLDYWRTQLMGSKPLGLFTDYIRPEKLSENAGEIQFDLHPQAVLELRKLASKHETTLYVVLLAIFRAAIYRATGDEDGSIAMVNANRPHPDLERLVGVFVNTHAIRLIMDEKTSFDDLVAHTRRVVTEALQNSDVPFDEVVAYLAPERELSRNALAQSVLVLTEDIRTASTRLDLSIHFYVHGNALRGFAMFQRDLFKDETIITFTRMFQGIVQAATHDPGLGVSCLPLTTLNLRNATTWSELDSTTVPITPEASLGDRFREVVLENGASLAATDGLVSLTYLELDLWSDRLASWLFGKRLPDEACIGVWMPRSTLLVVAYLACVKAGLAIMPLARDLPLERMRSMIHTTECQLVLCSSLCPLKGDLHCEELNEDCDILRMTPVVDLPHVPDSALSNIVFTSGSTGTPKAIQIEHRGMVNLCAQETTAWPGKKRNGLTTGIGFDPAGFQVFSSLLTGSSLHCLPEAPIFDAQAYRSFLIDNRIQRCFMTPSILAALLEETGGAWIKHTCLEHLILGGERLDPSKIALCRHHLPGLQILSSYGPAEASVRSASFSIPADWHVERLTRIPLGLPLPNVSLHIVDDQLNVVPPGVLGQLVVCGVNLARGYVGQPELTEQRFLDLPSNQRIYLTGDLGFWNADGLIEYVGRNDTQIKVRGQRIEVEEIETILNRHHTVKAAAVAAVKSKGDVLLVVFVQLAPDAVSDQVNVLGLWDQLYNEDGAYAALHDEDAGHDFARWMSMFNGERIPVPEMQQWLDDTLCQIGPRTSDHVLEVGVGTGQIALNLVEHTQSYLGTDLSVEALQYLARQIRRRGLEKKLSLMKAAAHELGDLEMTFSLIIFNSVVQYFPDAEYLVKVVGRLLSLMPDGGRIFFGDVRSYPLITYHDTERALASASHDATAEDITHTISQLTAIQSELLLSPSFFFDLQRRYPEITHIEVRPKIMESQNELSRYRYMVILHVGQRPRLDSPSEWVSWSDLGLVISELPHYLRSCTANVVGITHLPLEDLKEVEAILNQVRNDTYADLVALRHRLANITCSTLSVPYFVHRVAADEGWSVSLDYSHQGINNSYLQAVFVHAANQDVTGNFPPPVSGFKSHNTPATTRANNVAALDSLMQLLRAKLPESMIPNRMVSLPALPFNNNGKLDRRLLATPEYLSSHDDSSDSSASKSCTGPSNDTERRIMTIFAHALERSPETIDVQESLFNLGGHSLMATVVTSALRREFGLELSVGTVFKHPSIQALAAIVAERLQGNPNELNDTTLLAPPLDVARDLVKATIVANANHPGPTLFLFPESTGIASVYSSAFQNITYKVIAIGDGRWGFPRQEGETLESVTHEMLQQVLLHQQDGPFFLGGWSYGGYLAHEVAIQLQKLGKTIALVLMIDTSIYTERLRTSSWGPELDYLLTVVDDRNSWLVQFRRVNDLISDYNVPRQYQGRAVLVKALRSREPGEQAPPEDSHNGWVTYLPQVEVIGFDASHRRIFDQENGPKMGTLISQVLEGVSL